MSSSCITTGQGCGSAANYPQFIDTASCLCGLLNTKEIPFNGEAIEYWRCIGNASDDLMSGEHGKWYNTSLPSQELSGINQPQYWGLNGPNTDQAYTLENVDGKSMYRKLANSSSQLIGDDTKCTGKNNTEQSGTYYKNHKGMTKAMTSASSSMTGMSAASTMTSSKTSSTGTVASTTSSSSSTSAAKPGAATPFPAPPIGLKQILLLAILLTPMAAFLV